MDEQVEARVKPVAGSCSACTRRNWVPDQSITNKMMTSSMTWKMCLVFGALFALISPGGADPQDGVFNIDTVLGCYTRAYNHTVWKEELFRGTYCWDTFTVQACWGRCDSAESGDYKPPYKFSAHPVCTYKSIRTRRVRLTKCHPAHPDPYYEIFDAVECFCSKCDSAITSCENLHG